MFLDIYTLDVIFEGILRKRHLYILLYIHTNETLNGPKLKVKVWTAGRINVSVLIDRFEVHVQRAVHQYALETHYWKRPIQKCLDNLQSTWMEPITSVMDSALALGAANV